MDMRSQIRIEEIRNNPEKLDQFIIENQALVNFVIRKRYSFVLGKPEQDDYFQVGMLGLYKSILKFDSAFGYQFATYAVPKIHGEIDRYRRDLERTIRHPRTVKKSLDMISLQCPVVENITLENIIPDSKDDFADVETKLVFDQMLATLTDRDKEILKLRAQDNSQQSIAERLNIDQVTVSRRLSSIKKKLRNAV